MRNFANKGPYGQSYYFSSSHVWMWELVHKEGCVIKNWCFHIVVLTILERSNQSILKEISSEYSLEGLMLKLQYFGHRMQSADSLKKTWERLKAERMTEVSLTQWTWVWANFRRWWRTGKPGVLQSMESQSFQHYWVTEQQQKLTCNMNLLNFHIS